MRSDARWIWRIVIPQVCNYTIIDHIPKEFCGASLLIEIIGTVKIGPANVASISINADQLR